MRKYIAEGLGTFGLVFAGTTAIVVDTLTSGGIGHVGVAMTFGLIIMTMIFATAEISGGHINPAVTLGFFLAGRMPARDVVGYWISQIAGAIVASLLVRAIFGNVAWLGTTQPGIGTPMQSFALETVMTFFLVFVVLGVAIGSKEIGVLAGIAIGGTIGLDALFGGPVSGASMNPARSLGPAIVSGHLQYLWIYLAGPVLGSIIAVVCWHATRGPAKHR